MERTRVLCETLKSVGYDANSQTMEVTFRDGGVFHYFQIPETVYRRLLEAVSKATYFKNRVRPNYKFKRVS